MAAARRAGQRPEPDQPVPPGEPFATVAPERGEATPIESLGRLDVTDDGGEESAEPAPTPVTVPVSPPPPDTSETRPELPPANFGNPGRPESPPPEYSQAVEGFGAGLDGRRSLWHIPAMPDEAVARLREEVAASVEDGRGRNEAFRRALGAWMTPELLLAEWARLRSRSGLPVDARYESQRYPASLRLKLRLIGPGDPKMERLPGGPPVGIQRWAFGGTELGSTVTDSEFRPSLNSGLTRGIPITAGGLPEVSVTPRLTLEYAQLAVQSTVTQSHDWETLLKRSGGALPYDYTLQWELRLGDPLAVLWSGGIPEDGWSSLTAAPAGHQGTPLTVWFPPSDTVPGPLPAADPDRPETVPAALATVRHQFPQYAVLALLNPDQLVPAVARAFPDLSELSEESREVLAEFLSEGSVRSSLPRAWGRDTDADSVSSPTLYLRSGKPLYLRFRVSLAGGREITGPTAEGMILENYILRAQKAVTSATLTDSLGFQAPVQLTVGGTTGASGTLTIQPGFQHAFAHTLGAGSSSRVIASLRTTQDLHHVTPSVTFHWELVVPDGPPLKPDAGVREEATAQVQMLVPSQDTVTGRQAQTRYLPQELRHLRSVPLSATPIEVTGTEELHAQALTWLRANGYLPTGERAASPLSLAPTVADKVALLDNLRKVTALFSGAGLRSEVPELVDGGSAVWLEHRGRRVQLLLTATGRSADANVIHEGTFAAVSVVNFSGSSGLGTEKSTGTPGQFSVTATAGITDGTYLQSISPDVVGTIQRSQAVTSGSGTDSEVYLNSHPGTEFFSLPTEFTLSISDSSGATAEWKRAGGIRIAVPTNLTLAEPAEDSLSAAVTRSVTDDDLTALDGPGGGLRYARGILRLPARALINDAAGSREITTAVFDALNGSPPLADTATDPAPGTGWAAAPEPEVALPAPVTAAENHRLSMPGGYPPEEPAEQRQRTWLGRLRTSAYGENLIRPESHAGEFLTVSLSAGSLKVQFPRMLDKWVIEGTAERGLLASRTFTVTLRAYIKDPTFSREVLLGAEWWQQSTNSVAVTRTGQRSLGAGLTFTGSYGSAAESFKPSLAYNGSRSAAEGDTRGVSTGVWRVTTENGAVGFLFRGTVVVVAEIADAWRNGVKYVVAPGARRRASVAVEVPRGIEFMLFANDFHDHPELASLLPAGLVPAPAAAADRPLPDRYIATGGVLGFGVVTDVDIKGKRGALETAITDAVNALAPGALAEGHFASMDGVRGRINQLATAEGLSAVVSAGPDGWVAFHWTHRTLSGHRLTGVYVTARPRQSELAHRKGRLLTDSSGMDTVSRSTTGQGSALAPGVIARSRARRSHSRGLSFSPLTGERSFSEGPSLGWTVSPSLAYSLSSSREVRVWQATGDRTVGYPHVPYEFSVVVKTWPLTESAFGWLVTNVGRGLSSVADLTGLPEWLRKRGMLTAPDSERRAELDAEVYLRFSDSETPHRGHARPAAVPRLLEQEDPAIADPRGMGLRIPRALDERLTDADGQPKEPWRPARPVTVYGFDAVQELREALRAADRRLGAASVTPLARPSFTRSAETINVIVQEWAHARGATVPLDEATVTLILGSPVRSGISASLAIYDPKIQSSSRGMDVGLNLISSDGAAAAATVTSSPSITIGVNTPLAGHALDVARNQSIPLAGGNLTRGQHVGNYSVRRERSRIGSLGTAEGLVGHVVDGVAVIKISGPDGTRWVVGNVQFRTTEEIPDRPRFAIVTAAPEDDTIPEEPEPDEPYAGFGPKPRIHRAALVSHTFDLVRLLTDLERTETEAGLPRHPGNATGEKQVVEQLGRALAKRIRSSITESSSITEIPPLEQARIVIHVRQLTGVELALAQTVATHLCKQVLVYTLKYGRLITLCP